MTKYNITRYDPWHHSQVKPQMCYPHMQARTEDDKFILVYGQGYSQLENKIWLEKAIEVLQQNGLL